ncbi:Peroxisome biosynthesis protein pex1 [Coemansia sp. RSA 2611]|nr:Peroxisome biosynthesis protein pex1 [Coemansia sp. RSA 2611]
MSQKLVVAFRPLQTCMVSLPARWASALSEQNKGCMVFRLSWAQQTAYVAWAGGVSRAGGQRARTGQLSADVLEIDGTYARRLGLEDGAAVSVAYEPGVATCTSAGVEPERFDDWEILELNAGAVEARLLQQARVVAEGQPLVFWLNASTPIALATRSVRPRAPVCLLDNDTEVVVAPKVRGLTEAAPAAEAKQRQPICCLRVAADDSAQFNTVYASPQSTIAGQTAGQRGDAAVRIGHSVAAEGAAMRPWLARLEPAELVQPGVLLASSATLRAAGFAVGELVRVEPTATPPTLPAALAFTSQQPGLGGDDIRAALRQLLGASDKARLVLFAGMSIPDAGGAGQLARLASFHAQGAEAASESPEQPVCVAAGSIDALEIACKPEPLSLDSGSPGADPGPDPALAGIDAFLDEAWASVSSALMSRGSGGGVLVCGRRGSGKSSVARHLRRRAEQQRGRLVYCRHVDCARLSMDPRASAATQALQAIAQDVLTNQPSLLVLDDLDALVPAEADAQRARQVAEALVAALDVQDGRHVTVLATAAGQARLHARLFSAGLFGSVHEIPAPGKAERELVLRALAAQNATRAADVNYAVLSYLTEGFMPADLHELYARAVHEAAMRVLELPGPGAADVVVAHADLVRAHAGFRPQALRGVALQTSQTRWADIGGLADTRRQLRETLELPTKYAAIFATSPLRLRSGVLLFGHPGCGKTLLASAIARECGLNFIATKGPELLSKYIGSSEQSVRDLFKRAVAASPCVLFFDEFESIAPRRGHDNTGVTDRVVNQFLTEMDGAEGLKGVYVLAATSRPDLIDPALLRPGRLDKSFLCGMPGADDRRDILEKQAAKVRAAAVDWLQLAQRTDGFTGADLQALVYNAFLEAVHESAHGAPASEEASGARHAEFTVLATGAKPLSAVERTQLGERLFRLACADAGEAADRPALEAPAVPSVTMAHFVRALELTQSSLNPQDRSKFDSIYRDFVDDKRPQPVEQKATMA